MAKLIDANELKQLILAERDKIPRELPSAIYEFGIQKPNHHGNSMRGGIRKALRCLEQCRSVDAVEVVRCKDCKYRGVLYCSLLCQHPKALLGKITDNDFCSYGEREDNERKAD